MTVTNNNDDDRLLWVALASGCVLIDAVAGMDYWH
jgi:hypothetical protein